jgi:S1-C subfamily serine protease
MEHLSKQQLILLALLVSFVTSLSTGIVTVSLMSQAPGGVTQTVSQVIERTIQAAVPQNASVGSVGSNPADPTAAAVSKVRDSVVQLGSRRSGDIGGLGLVVSKTGIILTDQAAIASLSDYVAILPNGSRVPVSIVQMQVNGDIVFLAPTGSASSTPFTPISFGGIPKLGQSVLSLSGTSTPVLGQGIVSEMVSADAHSDSTDPGRIVTTIPATDSMLGSPLFASDGSVLGISTNSLAKRGTASFYPVEQLRTVVPSLR